MPLLVIAIEGPDLCGKTTVANLLVELLRQKFEDKVIFKRTAVPSDLITGTFTKILRNSKEKIPPKVFALTYAADHLYHYKKIIDPLKNDEKVRIVIQERSLLSTFIYQGLIAGVDLEWIKEINKFDKNIPDITIILKIDFDEVMKRKKLEKREFDKFEEEAFIKKQFEVYYNLPEELRKMFNVVYVEVGKTPFETAQKICEIVLPEIERIIK